MTKFNKALLASTAIAFATGLAIPASAQDPSAAPGLVASQKKVKIKLYGQIARHFGFLGDGESVTFKQGESSATSTRMGIDGRGKITNDISLRTRFEFNVRSGNTGGGSQFESQGGSGSRFTVRHLDVIISSKKFGAVWIGRGDSATNGSSEVNLAGVSSARLGGSTINNISAYRVLDTDVEPMDQGSIGSYFDNFDGASRTNRIRYDTPTFFGFKGSVGLIEKHNFDGALRYKGKIAGTAVAAAIGYCHSSGSASAGSSSCFDATYDSIDQLNGSISFKLPMGLGATFSGGTQWINEFGGQAKVDDPYNLAPSIFYTTKVTELGATTFEYAFQYCKNCDTGNEGNEGMGHMVTALQKIDAIGGDYYVNFNYVDVESDTNSDIDPVWFFGGGFRQRF
jgi:predicted porin